MRLFQRRPIVPVLRLSGAIGMAMPLRPGLSITTIAPVLERAFRMSKTPAVAIVINSPGGSPVQSHLIFQRLRSLAKEHEKKIYVFCEDVCASGGYFIAVAGDEIHADPSSIVGSIGVVTAGFGFTKLIENIGVERRIYTSGERKAALDPFSPEKPEEIERLKVLQRDVHASFIGIVRERRGQKLVGSDDDLFSGEFWSGPKARELGLIDGISDVRTKMREIYGDKVLLPVVSGGRGWLRRRILSEQLPFSLRGALGDQEPRSFSLSTDILSTLEARALWARFGL